MKTNFPYLDEALSGIPSGESYSADGLPIPKDYDHARFDPMNDIDGPSGCPIQQGYEAAVHHAEHGDQTDIYADMAAEITKRTAQISQQEGMCKELGMGYGSKVTNPKDAAGLQKTRFDLIPWPALVQIMPVMAYGAAKYAPFNWRDKTIGRMNYIAAALRHLAADADGQTIDPDSGLPHLAHAAATLLVLLDAQANGTMVDDRVFAKGAAADLMAALNRPAKPT